MISYDLCLAWNWEHDADFVSLLDTACQSHGLSLLQITPANIVGLLQSLRQAQGRPLAGNQITFRAFLDRASDADARFIPLVEWARAHSVVRINPQEQAARTGDKATMHLDLISAGLYTPYAIILPSYHEQPILPPVDLSLLGDKFTIKPAHGGGGAGVVMEATSLSQVLAARQAFPTDKYLLQAHVVPVHLDARAAWFRVIYCVGQVYPCWWDTRTHVYTPVTSDEETRYSLTPLRHVATSIARICGLELFSTEIALTPAGLFVVVDYVNDQLDLRLQSKTFDGVPDIIVRDVAERLVALVAAHLT